MSMVVRTNVMAMNSNRSLGINNSNVSKSLEKLSSGFRINRAADDASGLAISEKMKSQIKGLEQASTNSQDGISLIQTAEGATTEIHNMLNRMKELAIKSANGTIQDEVDREAIQAEITALNEEITRISSSTTFNGIQLLDGSLSAAGTGSVSGKPTEVSLETDKGGAELTTVDVAATKGNYTTAAFADGAIADGGKMAVTATLSDGSTVTVELYNKAFTDGTTTGGELLDADGNVLGTYDTAAVEDGDITNALTKAFKNSAIADDFKIVDNNTAAAGTIVFNNIEAGASSPQIVQNLNVKIYAADGAVNETTNAVTQSKGLDAYQTITAAQFTAYDGKENSVLTIDGKKFGLVAAGDVTETLVQKAAEQGVEIISFDTDVATGGAEIAAVLSERLGYDVTHDATDATFEFRVDYSVDAADGVGQGLTLQVGDTADDFNKVTISVDNLSAKGLKTDDVDLSTEASSAESVTLIENAINQVSTNRANLGALQNRLEYTINNLDVTAENMSAANSRIRDTDMATEMMAFTQANVLTQAAQAMLAQANQQPQAILQLLQ